MTAGGVVVEIQTAAGFEIAEADIAGFELLRGAMVFTLVLCGPHKAGKVYAASFVGIDGSDCGRVKLSNGVEVEELAADDYHYIQIALDMQTPILEKEIERLRGKL